MNDATQHQRQLETRKEREERRGERGDVFHPKFSPVLPGKQKGDFSEAAPLFSRFCRFCPPSPRREGGKEGRRERNTQETGAAAAEIIYCLGAAGAAHMCAEETYNVQNLGVVSLES